MFVVSVTVVSCVNLWAMDKIDKKIEKLENERSEINNKLVKSYGDSTMAYRMASKMSFSEIDQKIENFGNWLRTSDGHEDYMELKAEIEMAKEKELTN